MRVPFAHDAIVAMDPSADDRAPGGAITVALCGQFEHDPPCPLASHYTGVERDGDEVHLRILFACEPEDEPTVRERIGDALSGGRSWQLRFSRPSEVFPDEEDHALRLQGSVPDSL